MEKKTDGVSADKTAFYPKAMGYISMVDPKESVCQDCRSCEMYCAAVHDAACGLELNRIWESRDPFRGEYFAYSCKQCIAPSCVAACPEDAMYIDEKTGARCIDEEKCNGCAACIKACPVEPPRINYNSVKKKAVKCDLCKDRPDGPVCVQMCPTMCLTLKKYK
ncbi:MAG: 4Fe-4S dicluster domain-containing protein [Proteobacteria bacterium]|nr:4Fe-4S dicluster domain-containing protein [Pseudomonadota bacterium]MBU4009351.1 4Fe-4S dicluster domain-containing protein [Pseudomonadota bacterium]